jgi:hypothetical protein
VSTSYLETWKQRAIKEFSGSKYALELGKLIEGQQEESKALHLRAIASKRPRDRNRTKFPEFRKSDIDLNNGG